MRKDLVCQVCNIEFSTRPQKAEHFQNAHVIKVEVKGKNGRSRLVTKYKCSQCKNQYSRPSDLYAHIKNEHRGSKPRLVHSCFHCKSTFYDRDEFVAHLRSTHGFSKYTEHVGRFQRISSSLANTLETYHAELNEEDASKCLSFKQLLENKPLMTDLQQLLQDKVGIFFRFFG